MDKAQVFDDQTMKLILARGAELERREPGAAAEQGMHRLEDIALIAREAGISEESVRLAASELASGRMKEPSRFLGAPTIVEARLLIPRPSEESLEALCLALPGIVRAEGQGEIRKASLRWAASLIDSTQKGRSFSVEVAPYGKKSELAVKGDLTGAAGGIFGGVMGSLTLGMGMGLGMGVFGSSAFFTILFALAAAGPSYLLSRKLFKAKADRTMREVEAISRAIADKLYAAD